MYLKDSRDRAPGGLLVPVEWQADADEHHDGLMAASAKPTPRGLLIKLPQQSPICWYKSP